MLTLVKKNKENNNSNNNNKVNALTNIHVQRASTCESEL